MMKTTTLLFSAQQQGRLKANQQGMTLIEVLISMFVLAIGILALLSVQLRAVSSVREGETQTIVSQITQNMIEGMLINPVLSVESKTDISGNEVERVVKKSYDHYLTTDKKKSSGIESKDNFAISQIEEFRQALLSAFPDKQVFFVICRDDSGKAPTYASPTPKWECSGSGDTVIKVLWLADAEEEEDNEENKKNKSLITSGNYIVYTHQSRVTE
ncbi:MULTISPECIES: type IV pilus modification protein PilV [Neisseria]|nr:MULTISPECIES: type IV pilus modification protein PilV [Neisseria]